MPQGASDLLIQSAIAPAEQARRAWQAWTAQRSLDDASWAEVRMLPSVTARALELGIARDLLPRLDGIRRFCLGRKPEEVGGTAGLELRPTVSRHCCPRGPR
jgi:hypothetical protein